MRPPRPADSRPATGSPAALRRTPANGERPRWPGVETSPPRPTRPVASCAALPLCRLNLPVETVDGFQQLALPVPRLAQSDLQRQERVPGLLEMDRLVSDELCQVIRMFRC